MPPPRICDQGGCPALASHHIALYGQDFHFCNHHWEEVAPVIGERVGLNDRQLALEGVAEDRTLLAPVGSAAG
jgi:hypothetical protein